MEISRLPTPALLIDKSILEANLSYMAEKARQAGVALRPHIKTHKSRRIARQQLELGATGITCAKVSEAEVMAQAGIDDILIAYPVVGDYQIQRLLALAAYRRIIVGFDSLAGAQRLSAAAGQANLTLQLSLIIDTGNERDGVLPGEPALALAQQAAQLPNLALVGILTHEGHVYKCSGTAELKQVALDAAEKLTSTARLLRANGFPLELVSSGATPSCWLGVDAPGITEWRPGTYVFNDAQELRLAVRPQDCALSVLTQVISRPNEQRAVIDAGTKALSASQHPELGFGLVKPQLEAKVTRANEEHGIIEGSRLSWPIGQKIEVIPVHVCPVVNLADQIYLTEQRRVVDVITVDARGQLL